MDIYCAQCGEPWDMDTIHDVVADRHDGSTFDTIRTEFYRTGCLALGGRHGTGTGHPAIAAAMELLGDDVDGMASILDDFGMSGASMDGEW